MRTNTVGSLALAMVRAKLIQDDTDSESEPDSDVEDLQINKRKIISAVAKEDEVTEEGDDEGSPRTPPYAAIAARRSPSILPLFAIDVPFVRSASRRSGTTLCRHSGTETLVSLIARAEDFFSSPERSLSPSCAHRLHLRLRRRYRPRLRRHRPRSSHSGLIVDCATIRSSQVIALALLTMRTASLDVRLMTLWNYFWTASRSSTKRSAIRTIPGTGTMRITRWAPTWCRVPLVCGRS